MRTIAAIMIFLLVSEQNDVPPESRQGGAIADLKSMFDVEAKLRFEVIFMEELSESSIALAPEDLERVWSYKLVVSDFRHSSLRAKLIDAMKSSTFQTIDPQNPSNGLDIKWGCCFYDEGGHRRLSFYFNQWGTAGVINGVPVASNGKIVDVLKKLCAGVRQM